MWLQPEFAHVVRRASGQPPARTLLVWLYRCALANEANIPEALIAANDIVAKLFGDDLVITADRANHLTRSMAMDSTPDMAPCRTCGTDYVLSNGEGKIELAKDFVCPGCSYASNRA